MVVDPLEWAHMEFSECQLGDQRRTQRLIKAAAQVLARPDGSTPQQAESWADCKALYRLMDCDDIDFASITQPHYARTRQTGEAGTVQLILNDTTEINYGGSRQADGLGLVARNKGCGFFLHSALMRDPATQQVVGLAGQEIFSRQMNRKAGANNARRRDPQRESTVWGRLIDRMGAPPPGVTWLHVCDRGADDYEVYCHAHLQNCGWVIRACRLNRRIHTPAGVETTLEDHLDAQPAQGEETLDVAASVRRPARTARLELRFAALSVPRPRVTNAWMRQHAPHEPLPMWVVELIELDPPADADPVRWVLLTSERVETIEQARQIIAYYAQRWAVEEYHKALKTGCRVEARYYGTIHRLQRVTGLLAIVAVQLLKLRSIAQHAPDQPAAQVVPTQWVETLQRVRTRWRSDRRQTAPPSITIGDFVRHLAGLGGHLGRKGDGPPGWQTLWCGLEKLLLILRGTRLSEQKCG